MARTQKVRAKFPSGKSATSDITVVARGGRRLRLPQTLRAKPREPQPDPKPEAKTPSDEKATAQRVHAKPPADDWSGEITTVDQRGRQAGMQHIPDVTAPVYPEYGTWRIPLAAISGFAASIFGSGPAGDKLKATGVEYTTGTFSDTLISLNDEPAILASALPTGFTVTIARIFWGNWIDPDDEGSLPGACGLINITDGTITRAAFFTNWSWTIPKYVVVTLSGPPSIPDMLGKVLIAKQEPVYPGGYSYLAMRPVVVSPALYGNYHIIPDTLVLVPSNAAYEYSVATGIFELPNPSPMINRYPSTRPPNPGLAGQVYVVVALTGLPTPATGVIKTCVATINHQWTYAGVPYGGYAGVYVEVRVLPAPFNPMDVGLFVGQPGGRLTYDTGNVNGEETIVAQDVALDLVGRNLSELVGAYISISVAITGANVVFPAYVLNSLKFTLTLE